MVRTLKIFVLGVVLFSGHANLSAVEAAAPAWINYGHQLYRQQHYAEALTAYQKAIAIDSKDSQAFQALGNALVQLGRKEEGLQAYEHSLQLQPKNLPLEAYVQKMKLASSASPSTEVSVDLDEALSEGRGLLEQQRFEDALKLYKTAPAGSAKSSLWQQGQAEAWYGLGNMEEARIGMQNAANLDPSNSAAKDQLQRYLHPSVASDRSSANWFAPLWRSTLLPGWGQAYNGQKHKALVLGGLTWGLFAATAVTYVVAGTALDDYHRLGPGTSSADFSKAFTNADNLAVTNEALGLLFYTAYAYTLFDAATQARPALQAQVRGSNIALAWHQEF